MKMGGIENLVYSVSYDDLISSWLENFHSNDITLVVYDPASHIDFLKGFGFDIPEDEIYESKILTILLSDIDDGIWIIKRIQHSDGPYCQLWVGTRCITDNIEK